jgi:hypothetical protein
MSTCSATSRHNKRVVSCVRPLNHPGEHYALLVESLGGIVLKTRYSWPNSGA